MSSQHTDRLMSTHRHCPSTSATSSPPPAKRRCGEPSPQDNITHTQKAPKSHPRGRHGRRGKQKPETKALKLEKYVDSGGPHWASMVIDNLTKIYHHPHYPYECIGIKIDGALVREIIWVEYQTQVSWKTSQPFPPTPDKILVVPTPPSVLQADPQHPPYLMLCCVSVVPPGQALLLAAWDCVKSVSPKQYIKREQSHSATPAYHWGVWEKTQLTPYITSESSKQSVEAIAAIDKLLNLVGQRIVPKAIEMTQYYPPEQWKAQERAYNRVHAWLGDELAKRPALDFKGAFFTIAVKEGGMGDWEGGEFVAPQLGVRVPIVPGHLFSMMSRTVAHFTTPITSGQRVVFTCFTDKNLWAHTDLPTTIIG
ncbi:hypothetical protein K443DRAFT_125203 [Laccaria amethystina LaAM-08-1]|uniref:Uncharacterized protein n=1 Tax=Laccaria amethystina LaAM-08-1 TaxID=1095629 RepID=A0A0C9WJC9_9AGAR|nr:hypothetical protein K443DRAFT_125203 [Laccaria amethystina LaAM-08-1]